MTAAHRSTPKAPAAFELKSAALTLICVVIKTRDLSVLAAELGQMRAETPGLFEQDPVVVDVSALRDAELPLDFAALLALLRAHQMVPVAVKGASSEQAAVALALGLSEAPEGGQAPVNKPVARDEPQPDAPNTTPEPTTTSASDGVKQTASSVPDEPAAQAMPAARGEAMPTVVIDRPLRSGQQVYARGADLVVMAAVSFGAEVIADGHIHIYAPLRGRAIAGARGNQNARIFTTCMAPQLVSIAGIYRTSETDLSPEVQGKPAQVRLEGERLVIEPIAV